MWIAKIGKELKEFKEYWEKLLIYPLPFPHITVFFNEKISNFSWPEKMLLETKIYGTGKMPEIGNIIYWIWIEKEEIEDILQKEDEIEIKVYETEEEIIAQVNEKIIAKQKKPINY